MARQKYDYRLTFKLKSCLGYFSIPDAIRVLGIISIAGLCGDIASGHLFIALVRATQVVAFIGTRYQDSAYWRMLFFYAFIFNVIAQPTLVLMGAEGFEINA